MKRRKRPNFYIDGPCITVSKPNFKTKYWQKRVALGRGFWAFVFRIAKQHKQCVGCNHFHYPCLWCYDHGCGGPCVEFCGCTKFVDPPLTPEEEEKFRDWGFDDV